MRPEQVLEQQLRSFAELCRARGLKVTHQRLEIYRALAVDGGHPTAETIFTRVRARVPPLSLDTVYRTLATFTDLGIIQSVNVLECVNRYDSNTSSHHHLVCRDCQCMVDFEWPEFDRMPVPFPTEEWGVVEGRRLEVYGVCKTCRSSANRAGSA